MVRRRKAKRSGTTARSAETARETLKSTRSRASSTAGSVASADEFRVLEALETLEMLDIPIDVLLPVYHYWKANHCPTKRASTSSIVDSTPNGSPESTGYDSGMGASLGQLGEGGL